MDFLFLVALISAIFLWIKKTSAEKEIEKRNQSIQQQSQTISALERQLSDLEKYREIVDAHREARDILSNAKSKADAIQVEANEVLNKAKSTAENVRKEANQTAQEKIEQADSKLRAAGEEASRIVASAKHRAEEIAGEAYSAMNRAKEFADTAQAMKNIINGYGDSYIIPSYSLLDDLADEFGYTEAGKKLKEARDNSRAMVKAGMAATCDYVETNRKETAIRFVVDAFNGKVDSILSRSKADNHGKLEQEIRDAFSLVNYNGTAFRNAKITDQYLTTRLNELKWAATAHALKDEEREEQRRLRDQIREEEKARREFERAIKDAAKEEDAIKKAMEKVQQQVAAANEAQRAEFETKLHELEAKLKAAEEKNQRALSMAQQTRTGHVYVISNIGSFGEDVFKIGMTRRLEPNDRIRELGDASVPFEFDVHAMIYSEDAPTLERKLHRHFLRQQINKVNPRKEFFRLGLADIRREVESFGVLTHWTMTAEAQHYRESLRIEQQIQENPAIEREWTRHQLDFEAIPEEEIEPSTN
ncbi:MAG TPA: DUF4041 domain-containing protein [Sideroxyarcus sp.]|nr:DUF4041 domain-containing protein [Sideroxyarcus sp.]